jgi:hypothetical protein
MSDLQGPQRNQESSRNGVGDSLKLEESKRDFGILARSHPLLR